MRWSTRMRTSMGRTGMCWRCRRRLPMLEGAGSHPTTTLNPERWYSSEEFRRAWWVTEAIPGSFTRLNGAAYWDIAWFLPKDAILVEVGVDQGRSASLLCDVMENQRGDLHLNLVDSWESILIDNLAKTKRMVDEFPDASRRTTVLHMKSETAALRFADESVDFVHIDAHHYHPSVDIDCESWMPKLRSGGIWAMHDVAATFPDVDEAVAKYTAGWEMMGLWDCLGVWRKP